MLFAPQSPSLWVAEKQVLSPLTYFSLCKINISSGNQKLSCTPAPHMDAFLLAVPSGNTSKYWPASAGWGQGWGLP